MKYIKRLLSCAIVVFIIFGLTNYTTNLLWPSDLDVQMSKIKVMHTLPEDSVEVIIYGSSRAMRHIDVMEMYNQYGIGAFNYGSTWIHLNTCLVYLADSFKTQHPKVAVIETSLIGDPLPEKNQEGEILVTSALASSVEKFRFIRQCFGYDVITIGQI